MRTTISGLIGIAVLWIGARILSGAGIAMGAVGALLFTVAFLVSLGAVIVGAVLWARGARAASAARDAERAEELALLRQIAEQGAKPPADGPATSA